MVSGIVEDQNHALSRLFLAQKALEKAQESCSVEDRAHHAHELSGTQTDGTETGHGFSGRCMPQDGILDFRRNPHAAARAMLLEVAFIQTPQLNVAAASQSAEFFLLPRLSKDQIEPPGDVACVAENQVAGTAVGIDALQDLHRIGGANALTRQGHPTGWRPNRSHAESFADHPAIAANPSNPGFVVVLIARRHARRQNRPLRNGSPSAAQSFHSRQTTRRPLDMNVLRLPATTRAAGDRNVIPRYARSPAESLSASPRHLQSVAFASSFSQRELRAKHNIMLRYLCRRV